VYGGGVLFVILTFVLSTDVRGASRWLKFGPVVFQPSEFMKLGLVLAVARFLSDDPKTEARTLLDLAPAGLLCFAPAALVMLQPDFGTAMVYVLAVVAMLAMTKIRRRSLLSLGLGIAVAIPITWNYVLRDYQKNRVLSFLNPEADLTG